MLMLTLITFTDYPETISCFEDNTRLGCFRKANIYCRIWGSWVLLSCSL